jgi:hypothetical protein
LKEENKELSSKFNELKGKSLEIYSTNNTLEQKYKDFVQREEEY